MFDSVLGKGNVPQGRFGVGTVVSVVVHVGVLALALYLSTRPPPEEEIDTEVTFFAAPPPPPPPPAASRKSTPKEVKPRPVRKPDTVVTARDQTPQEPQETSDEEPQEEIEGGVVGGVEGGVVGGVIGGVIGGQLGGTGTEVVPFGEGMNRPEQLTPKPEYTNAALEARVEGTMLVKCVITAEGRADRCRIIKPLPYMDEAVLSSLRTSRWKPASFQGRPISVEYTIRFRFDLPE